MLESFKSVITEAKISAANFDKAVVLLVSMLSRKTGSKFYRFGGKFGSVGLNRGTGILYFYDKQKAIRFNHDGSEFSSITLWKSFKMGQPGDVTLKLDGLNIVGSAKYIIDVIMKPTPGKYEFYSTELNEAKRVSPEDFYMMINAALTPHESISSVTWERMANVANGNDILIPTIVRNTAVGKGKTKRFDLTKLLSGKDSKKVAQGVEPTNVITVSSGDSNNTSSGYYDQNTVNKLQKTVSDAVNKPSPEAIKTMSKDANTLFGHMKSLAQVVARGKRNSLVITGGAGIGKSFTIFETLKEEGMVKNTDWYLIKGKITTASLYQNLFLHRNKTLLVFDDTDSVWGDQDAANILKAALDSYDERFVSWYSARTVNVSKMMDYEKEEFYANIDSEIAKDPGNPKIKLPSEFEYTGRIIFISNLPQAKLDPAVLNRSAKIDMDLTTAEIFARIDSILPFIGDKSVPIDAKREIFDFIKQKFAEGLLDSPSIRTYVGAEDLYRSGLPNWRELLDYV